jgi:hypothetical protein
LPNQIQEASWTPNRLGQNRTSPWDIIVKTTREKGKNTEGSKTEKKILFQSKPIKITADFSTETLKTKMV